MKKLTEDIRIFTEERGWTGNRDPRNLAISISLEANELLEHFQWNPSAEKIAAEKEKIAEEAADVFIYLLQLADVLDVDLMETARQKLQKNKKRFPTHT